MAEIYVRSDDASQLDELFQNGQRRASLKSLRYEIILPSYSAMRWSKLPSRRECLENNTVFTRELRNLFTKLHSYDEEDGATPFRLELGVSSPRDSFEPSITDPYNAGTGPDRNNNTYIYFDPGEQEPLPVLTKVIEIEKKEGRKLHPTILGLVLRSLPVAETIRWDFMGPDVRLLDLRKDIRTSLARALLSSDLSSLREFHLAWSDAECGNHSFHAGSLLNPETGVDDLSVALRKIAQLSTIKTLKLTGKFILSPEFFHSPNPDADSIPASWPSLEILELRLSPMTPGGDWYYTGDPSLTEPSDDRAYEEEEEVDSSDSEFEDYPAVWDWVKLNGEQPQHQWRNQPNTQAFNLFLLELAKSVPQMPALRRLTCQMGSLSNINIRVEFLSAREKPDKILAGNTEIKIYDWPHWEVILTRHEEPDEPKTTWEMPEELKQAWKFTTGSHVDRIHVFNEDQLLEL